MRRTILSGVVSLGLFVVWFACSSAPVDLCNVVGVLENKDVETQLTAASAKRPPTEIEWKATALYWGLAVLATGEGEVDSFLTETPMSELLQNIPKSYPELVARPDQCVRTGTQTQTLIASKADFSCSNPCVLSPELLSKTGKTIQDKLIGDVVKQLKQAGKYTKRTQWARDKLAQIKKAQRELAEQYKVANKVYTWSQKINDLLDILDKAISLQEAEDFALEVLDVMEDVAKLVAAKKLAMVLVASQVGWEIGKTAGLVYDCQVYKSNHCAVDWAGTWSGTYKVSFQNAQKEMITNSGNLTMLFELSPVGTSSVVDVKVTIEYTNWKNREKDPVYTGKSLAQGRLPSATETKIEMSVPMGNASGRMVLNRNGKDVSGTFDGTSFGHPETTGTVSLKKNE